MTKLTCDITKDLIPSYLDGICSEDSRQAVEEHLETCEACRSCLAQLRETELTADRAEKAQLNFMKKVKRHYAAKNALGVVLLFVLSLATLILFPKVSPGSETDLYCVLFPVLTLGVFFLLSNYRAKPPRSRLRTAAAVLSALGILYSILLGTLTERAITTFTGFWGMELSSVGPFLHFRFLLVVLLELAVFAGCAWSSIKNEHSFGFLPLMNLAGCALSLSCNSLLYYMDSAETAVSKIRRIRIMVCLVTAATAAAELILENIRARNREKKETA